MSVDCGNHDNGRRKLYRRLLIGAAAIAFLVLLIILILWLALRPSNPQFYLQDTSVFQLDLTTGTDLLTTVMQVTLSAHNPNDRVGILYEKLDAFAAYMGQQITAPTALPCGYQANGDVPSWSPFVYGADVPVAPYLAAALTQDDVAGLVRVDVRVEGSFRWKVAAWESGHSNLRVRCPVLVAVDRGQSSGDAAPLFRCQQTTACIVDV